MVCFTELITKVFEWIAAPVCAWVDGWVHRCGEKQEKSRESSAGVRVGWWVGSQVFLGLPASALGSQSAPLPIERSPPRRSGRWGGGQLINN